MKKKRAFTLIELIAVLVILAILALIVTPLVMNIIKKAKDAANKRSIDAYGRSVEIAIANHLLETGTFPTNVSQLTIEYTGKKVVCETAKLNNDSSVYLAGCTVGGKSVDYTYGSDKNTTYEAYNVGDAVIYNGVAYYVIKNSSEIDKTLTLLKANPITSSEISSYLSSTEIANKVDTNGTYAKMAYYAADDCLSSGNVSGCSTDYSVSNVKRLVDLWTTNNTNASDLVADTTGYKSRLITFDEIERASNLQTIETPSSVRYQIPSSDSWLYSNDYRYWTMSQYSDSTFSVWISANYDGTITYSTVGTSGSAVRPVITIKKSDSISKLKSYSIGDEVTYNNIDFYVIENNLTTVTLMKKEPLSYDEVVEYGSSSIYYYQYPYYVAGAKNKNGYGYITYSDNTSEYTNGDFGSYQFSAGYNGSSAKVVVDGWTNDKISPSDLEVDSRGYKDRLITIEELTNNLGCSDNNCSNSSYTWLTSDNYNYYTMSQSTVTYYAVTCSTIFIVNDGYRMIKGNSNGYYPIDSAIRPVVTIKKSSLN